MTRDIVREIALKDYSLEKVNEYIDLHLDKFQKILVDEFNQRLADKRPLRFQITDDSGIGKIVAGNQKKRQSQEIRFQNSIHKISPAEFEKLSAVILRIIGCEQVFSTPSSHDQGVDAFGWQSLVRPTPYGVTHGLTWIAQAKHYESSHVTTGDIRELVGSRGLLLAKVFSTVGDRYKELHLRAYAPTAIVLITTEEIPTTVRRLADGAGAFVFASSDLFHILAPSLKRKYTVAAVRALINNEARTIRTLN
ncbi:MAG TPA: restriction endonuclease [Terracidiphilus sp.]|nr:restriction endonuclease [Terracidiphilus sp.]